MLPMTVEHQHLTEDLDPYRIIELKPKEGEKTLNSAGLVDPRLFKGENKLRAVMDNGTCLWFMRYEKGAVPEPLKQKFTTLSALVKYAKSYFDSRGIQIEVTR